MKYRIKNDFRSISSLSHSYQATTSTLIIQFDDYENTTQLILLRMQAGRIEKNALIVPHHFTIERS